MRETGKKKKARVNLIDALCVILVIILAAGVYVRFFRKTEKAAAKESEFYYSFQVIGIKQQAVSDLQKSKGLPFRLDEKITDDMGELITIEVSGNSAEITRTDGVVVSAAYPERYDAVLTFKIKGSVTEGGYYTRGLNRINAGSWATVRSKWTAVQGYFINVWESGQAAPVGTPTQTPIPMFTPTPDPDSSGAPDATATPGGDESSGDE